MCYSSLMPEVIFALYWHSVEIQEHHAVAPSLQLFKFTRQKGEYLQIMCSQWWEHALGMGAANPV